MTLAMIGPSAWGQLADANTEKPKQDSANGRVVDTRPYQTIYLTNVTQQADANEIVVAVRNLMDTSVKIYLVLSQNAIAMRATPDQFALAQKVVADLDRPRKIWRLTYTMTEIENGRRIGVQHYSMIATAGQRTLVKQGSRVPIMTGSTNEGGSTQSQVQYVDLGLTFNTTLDQYSNGAMLRAKVEQSSAAEEKSGVGPQDPVVRQTSLESTSFLIPGKPLVLGSLDIPGSTRHLDVDAMIEPVTQ